MSNCGLSIGTGNVDIILYIDRVILHLDDTKLTQ